MKWLNLSLNEKMLSADASESESRASKLFELVEVLSQGKSRNEMEALLSSRYGDLLWCDEGAINLPFVRFIYTGDSLDSVSDQTQIEPRDKG
ncbi:hypothetical protein [Alcanivorax sp. S6407]|uniref:hypothetical protein n=1 Tax=Alcanivorax sp. S6407 TaxID=2926424 RepID=UPI001FF3D608|nr:hypothetical protein [Alcanivorax sp. S6407]